MLFCSVKHAAGTATRASSVRFASAANTPRAPSVAPITSAHSPSLNASCSTITTAMLYWFDVPDAACCWRLYRITSTNDAFCTSISSKENHFRKTPPAERSGVVSDAPRMGGIARGRRHAQNCLQAAVGRQRARSRLHVACGRGACGRRVGKSDDAPFRRRRRRVSF